MDDIRNLIASMPNETSGKENQLLGKYITKSDATPFTNCLQLVLNRSGKKLEDYVKLVGKYNFIKASNPVFHPEREVPFKDYAENCPEGWRDLGNSQCVSDSYTGPCNSGKRKCKQEYVNSGRTKPEYYTENEVVNSNDGPSNFAGYSNADKENWARSCGVSWTGRLGPCPDNWTNLGGGACRSPDWYWGPCSRVSGFNGYDDNAKRSWSYHCNAPWNNATYGDCPDGWTKQGNGCCGPSSYKGRCASCKDVSRTVQVQRTRQIPIWEWQDKCVNDPATNLRNYTVDQKIQWENSCKAYWPTKKRIEEAYWSCNYGSKLGDGDGVMVLGNARSIADAMNLVLQSYGGKSPKYFGIGDGEVYLAQDGSNGAFTDKGEYQKDCKKDNKLVELYEIDNILYDKLKECAKVNDWVNTVQLEGFEGGVRDVRYLWLVIFIIIFLVIIFYFR